MNENDYPTVALYEATLAEVTRLKVENATLQADAKYSSDAFDRLYDTIQAAVTEMLTDDDTDTLRHVEQIREICKELDIETEKRVEYEVTVTARFVMEIPIGANPDIVADSIRVTDFGIKHDEHEIEMTQSAQVYRIDTL
jgi:hypothetical protein